MVKSDLNILTFSTLYPHAGEPSLGIFVENRLLEFVGYSGAKAKVVAPVPWFPFKSDLFGDYARAANAEKRCNRAGIDVVHPRYLVLPKIGMRITPNTLYRAGMKAIRQMIAKGFDFDVLDAHYLYPDGVAAAQIAKELNKPYVLTARGSDVTEIARHYPFARQQIIEACNGARSVITVGSTLKTELIEYGVPEQKIQVLRNGVDLVRFQPKERTVVRERLGLSGTVLLAAGWLIPRKRPDLVLDAVSKLPGVNIVFAGDGPLRAELEQRVKSDPSLSGRVTFLGRVRPEDMPDIYSAADALLLFSDLEGWANVLLEAMACGTPVVTRNAGAAADLMTNDVAGRLVESDDPVILSSAITDLLNNYPDRNAVREFASNYGWEETSEGQLAIFNEARLHK